MVEESTGQWDKIQCDKIISHICTIFVHTIFIDQELHKNGLVHKEEFWVFFFSIKILHANAQHVCNNYAKYLIVLNNIIA